MTRKLKALFSPAIPWLFLFSTSVAAGELKDPAYWLDRMGAALLELNYQGTFVYLHDQKLEAMEIVHRVDENGERERLFSLNGAPREIIRDSDEVKCYLTDDKAVLVGKGENESPLPRALVSDPEKLSGNYEFVDLGYGRITGRHCKYIGIKPKDVYRYGYRICIDKKTGLPLKSELVDESGAAIEQVMFTRLTVGEDIDDSLLVSKVDATNFRWLVQDAPATLAERAPRWAAKEIPPGFEISAGSIRTAGTGESTADHVIFTDGLASVSVFAETGDATELSLNGLSNIGAVNAFGTRVGNHNITVVGEVPSATVELIARSIEFASTDQP